MTSAPPSPILDLQDQLASYASYTREASREGEEIVDCLLDIMEDDSAKPYERLDAQLLLDAIGFGRIAVQQAAAGLTVPQPASPDPPRPANPRRLRRPTLDLSEEMLFHLPPLVRRKTDGGRRIADFLVSAVRGQCPGFEPCHRIRAAKHLAARAFSNGRVPEPSLGDAKGLMENLHAGRQERKAAEAAAEQAKQTERDEQDEEDEKAEEARRYAEYRAKFSSHPRDETGAEYEKAWYDFSTYGAAEFKRDCYGHYALVRIMGSDAAAKAATHSVVECASKYRYKAIDVDDPPPSYDPPESERGPDPYGRDSHGYRALLYMFGSVESVRAANKGAERYERRVEQGISDDPLGLSPYKYEPCEYICDHCDCDNADCRCACGCVCHGGGSPSDGARDPPA